MNLLAFILCGSAGLAEPRDLGAVLYNFYQKQFFDDVYKYI
jgi:hypothetical protein